MFSTGESTNKTHIRQTLGGGAVKTKCNTPPPFKDNISVADCMLLSSLLKTIKFNAGVERVYENFTIVDEYLVDPAGHA